MFGNEGVSQSSHDMDVSRLNKKISALEIRIGLMESTIKSDPDLLAAYQKAWTAMSERRTEMELKFMGAGW